MVLRELFVRLGLQTDDAAFAKTESKIGALKAGLAGLGVALTAGAVYHGIKGLIHSTYQAGWEAQRTAERVGVSTDALQELREAADDVGISHGAVEQGLRFLARNSVQAARGAGDLRSAFQRVGVSVTDGAGKIRGADAVLMDLADAFARMPEAERPAEAMRLLGRSGGELVPLLIKGTAGLEEMRKAARDAGLVLGKDVLDATTDYHDALDALQDTVKGLRYSIGGPLLKEATRLLRVFQKWIEQNRELLRQRIVALVQGLMRAFESLVHVLEAAIEGAMALWRWLGEVARESAVLKGLFIALAIAGAIAFAPVLTGIAAVLLALEEVWGWVTGKRKTLLEDMFGSFADLKLSISENPITLAVQGWIRWFEHLEEVIHRVKRALWLEKGLNPEEADALTLKQGLKSAGVTGMHAGWELAKDPRFTALARAGDFDIIAREYGPTSPLPPTAQAPTVAAEPAQGGNVFNFTFGNVVADSPEAFVRQVEGILQNHFGAANTAVVR
jgi:hypothetical protein